MKKKVFAVIIFLIIFVMCVAVKWYCENNTEVHEAPLITVKAQTPEEAACKIGDMGFDDGEFYDISIADKELIDYTLLKEYDNLTSNGTVYSYELIYKFKTDDERAFIENKITGNPVATNVWIEDWLAHQVVVMFENEGVYYKVFVWDWVLGASDNYVQFYYANDDYGSSDSCQADWLECNIIRSIFENNYNIPDLQMASNATSNSILRKLIRDIEMHINPDYQVDESASRIYNITFDEEIKCIYFKADLYDVTGKEIAKDKGFALFLNGGFSIYGMAENSVGLPINL